MNTNKATSSARVRGFNLGDQDIRMERFHAHGLPCIKEVIVRRPRSDDPKVQEYFYVDTGKLAMLAPTVRDRLKKTCKTMAELENNITRLAGSRNTVNRRVRRGAQRNTLQHE